MTMSREIRIDTAAVRRPLDRAEIGYCTNRFERTPDGWRIASVKLTPLWMTGNFGILMTALSDNPSA